MAYSRTTSYDALLSTTLDKYYKSGKMHDAIFNSNPTFATLKEKGKVQYADGGYQIQVNLMYGQNTTVGSYSRYEVLDVAPQDGMQAAFYSWAQYAGSVAIDGLSEFQNSGAGRLVKLLGEKTTQTTMTFSETLNEHLHDVENVTVATGVTGNGGKNINSLPLVAYKDGTGMIGAHSGSVYTWWKNQFLDFDTLATSDNYDAVSRGMQRIYNLASKGTGGAPDLLISGMGAFEGYENAMDAKKRYLKYDRATAGFESVYYKGAKYFWDVHCCDQNALVNWDSGSYANDTLYALNTKFLKLMIGKGKDFRPTPFQSPEDQDARVANFIFYGQLVCSNRRKQGVLFDIEDNIVAP